MSIPCRRSFIARTATAALLLSIMWVAGCRCGPRTATSERSPALLDNKSRLVLCNVHYHCPPEHGKRGPEHSGFAYGIPNCAEAGGYLPPTPQGHADAGGEPAAGHHPTVAPEPGAWVEIHYVYGLVTGTTECLETPIWKRELEAPCCDPREVTAVWAKVVSGTNTWDWTKSPPLDGGHITYPGTTTGSSKGALKVTWRVLEKGEEINVDELNKGHGHADEHKPRIDGHPTRPIK